MTAVASGGASLPAPMVVTQTGDFSAPMIHGGIQAANSQLNAVAAETGRREDRGGRNMHCGPAHSDSTWCHKSQTTGSVDFNTNADGVHSPLPSHLDRLNASTRQRPPTARKLLIPDFDERAK